MKTFSASGIGPWLSYAPHRQFELPYLVDLERPFKFHNDHDLPAFEVEWPGQIFRRTTSDGYALRSRQPSFTDVIPGAVLAHWRGTDDASDMPVSAWLREGPFPGTPDMWLESLQYHVAVNHTDYATGGWVPKIPVARLPHDVVQKVIGVRLAVSPAYHASILHLEHLAGCLDSDPFLTGDFDTHIRDSLYDLTVTAVQKFFVMVGDCIFNEDVDRWEREPIKQAWENLAAYLWWVGRTGSGLYASFAGLRYVEPTLKDDIVEWGACFDADLHPQERQDALARVLWKFCDNRLWSADARLVTPVVQNLEDLKALCAAGIGVGTFRDEIQRLPQIVDGEPHSLSMLPQVQIRYVMPKHPNRERTKGRRISRKAR